MATVPKNPKSLLDIYLRRHDYGRVQTKRPISTTSVQTTEECVKWRKQTLSEISNEIALIQDPLLGELKIRQKNDYINKLLREKQHWDNRIIELSGIEFAESIGIDCTLEKKKKTTSDKQRSAENDAILGGDLEKFKKRQRFEQYRDQQRQMQKSKQNDSEKDTQITHTTHHLGLGIDVAKERVIGVNGYYYFGVAKDLPGVRELFEQSQVQIDLDKKRRDIRAVVDASYYGFLEEYNEQLLHEEALIEQEMLLELAME